MKAAAGGGDPEEQVLQVLHGPNRDPGDEAVGPRHTLGLQHFRNVGQAVAMGCALGRVAGGDPDHRLHRHAECGQVQLGVVAAHDAGLLQAADPLCHRGWAQADPASELGKSQTRVLLEGFYEAPVGGVKRRCGNSGHRAILRLNRHRQALFAVEGPWQTAVGGHILRLWKRW